jgi:hypothetical protein
MSSMKKQIQVGALNILLVSMGLLLGGSIPLSAAGAIIVEPVTCTCYWDADCGTGGDCTGYGKCTRSGKLDGTCKTVVVVDQPQAILSGDAPQQLRFAAEPEELAAAVDLYFKAYLKPARLGDGTADARLFSRAQAVWLGSRTQELHAAVQEAIHEALDTTLGFDFVFPEPACFNPSGLGNLRAVPEAGPGLIQAVRIGFTEGILNRDPSAVDQPLREFWKQNPDYHPNHTGRYYPHGHTGESHDPELAQREALQRILTRLIELM